MPDKLYLWRIKLRGHHLWCHAPSSAAAFAEFTKQTGEPIMEYCLECAAPKNLDGTPITESERLKLLDDYINGD